MPDSRGGRVERGLTGCASALSDDSLSGRLGQPPATACQRPPHSFIPTETIAHPSPGRMATSVAPPPPPPRADLASPLLQPFNPPPIASFRPRPSHIHRRGEWPPPSLPPCPP